MDEAADRARMHPGVGVTFRRQAIFWGLLLVAVALLLWLLGGVLLPFVAGMALAYMLDPLADRLQALGLSRMAATVTILASCVLALLLAMVVLVPLLADQAARLVATVPDLLNRLEALISSLNVQWLQRLRPEGGSLGQNAGAILSQGSAVVTTLLGGLWASGQALFGLVSLFVVTPVVAFYLLYDWDRMIAKVDAWLPLQHKPALHRIAREIDEAVAGFVRGQGTLCLVLGTFYGVALTLAGLNFGLLIGLGAGLISFIPYVGSLTGFVLSVGVALFQWWPEWPRVAVVVGIFVFGQFVEGNILQPKLVGDRVGLHPVWVMFALIAFGALFGFTGLLVAVPVAAAIGVVLRFALERYLESEMYRGRPAPPLAEALAGPGSQPPAIPISLPPAEASSLSPSALGAGPADLPRQP